MQFLLGEKKYLYLMRGTKWMFKIGISNDPKRRVKEVSHNAKIVSTYKYYHVEKVEKFFHTFFADSRRTRSGSGKTEWFRLGILEFLIVKFLMIAIKILQEGGIIAAGIAVVMAILYVIDVI